MTDEAKKFIKNCWLMTTNTELDDENKKLKIILRDILDENMTPSERSRYGYSLYIRNKQYNSDLQYNIDILEKWADKLQDMGNSNYPYIYAMQRVLNELRQRL